MAKPSRFVATVKERQRDEPCFVAIEHYEDIGLPTQKQVMLNLPEGTGIEEARALAKYLNEKVASVGIF